MKMAQVSDSLRSAGSRKSDQAAVWNSITNKFARFGAASDTSAMSDIYEQEEAPLEDYVNSFSALEEQSGAVFAIDQKIVGLELFDSAETLRKLFPKILRSYGLDALDHARLKRPKKRKSCTSEQVSEFLKKVTEAKAEEFPALGEGLDVRLSGDKLTGAALAVDDRIIHLTAFAVRN